MFSTWQAVKSGVPRSLTLTLIHYASSEILLRKEKVKKIKSHKEKVNALTLTSDTELSKLRCRLLNTGRALSVGLLSPSVNRPFSS